MQYICKNDGVANRLEEGCDCEGLQPESPRHPAERNAMRTLEELSICPDRENRAKGEEPMRMKHGSDRGPTISMKPRLLAAFTAVAMMFATAVPALMPRSASADDGIADGATCTPRSIEMGAPDVSGNNNVGKDDDVATWVGGNMYLGAPVDATTTQYGLNEAAIDATYAVEAEGLTLVNGKLLSNAIKKSWDEYGFRFGVVGFGSQFRPAAGSDALVVGGNTSNVTLKDFFGTDVNALAFDAKGRAWIGKGKTETSANAYVAKIAGSSSARLNADNVKRVLPPVAEGHTRVFTTYNYVWAWNDSGNLSRGTFPGNLATQQACGAWKYADVKNDGKTFNAIGANATSNKTGTIEINSSSAAENGNSVVINQNAVKNYGVPACMNAASGNVTNVIVPKSDGKPPFAYDGISLEPSRNLGQWYVFEVPITDRQFSVNVYGSQNYTINPTQGSVYTIWKNNVETGDPASLGHLENDLYSVYVAGSTGEVKWNAGTQEKPNPLQTVKIIANDQTKEVDYSDYNNTIKNLSSNFANVPASEQIDATVGFAGADDNYTRYKYLPTDKENTKISMKFDGKSEKLITFDGKNAKGGTIVFRLPASYLTNTQGDVTTNGIDFEFKNVGKKTVIVNIVNDDGAAADATNTIEFNTGWRFWWGEGETTREISNGYSDAIGNSEESKAIKNAYSTASQSIMWNFPSTSKLTINGGQIKKDQVTNWTFQGQDRTSNFVGVEDDPSAAMIGSILVPNGSFEDHVSTNGRVYVGGDFMMYNPTAVEGTGATDATASVIDMDQERHNFPWHGALSTQCSAIGWTKVKKNQSGTYEALGGTSWKVYATLDNAVAGTPPLLPGTVVDNNISTGDANSTSGAFTINNLKENAAYYIQEANAPDGYKVNPYIYQIKTGDKGTTTTAISKVYKIENSKAVEITGSDEDKLLNGNSIINENDDVDISWGKKSSEDTSNAPTALPGSEWTLTDKDGNKYTITDNGTQAKGVQIWYNGKDESGKSLGEFEMGGELQLSAKTTPDGADPSVHWTSSDPDYVQVSRTGRVFLSAYNPDKQGKVTITATSDDNAEATASVTLTVKAITPTKFELMNNGSPVTSLDMNVGETEQLTATVEPSPLTPVWTTEDADVATVENGVITAKGEGQTTIKVTVGTMVKSVTVTVTDKKKTVIYVKSNLVTDNDKRYQYIITNLDNWALNKDHTLTQSKYEGYYSTTIQTDGNAFQFQLWNGSSAYYKPNGVGQLQINGGSAGLNWYSPAGTTALTINQWNDAYTGTPRVGYSLTRSGVAQADTAPQSVEAVMDEPVVAVLLADTPTDAPAADNNNQPSYMTDRDGRTGMFKLTGVPEGTYKLQESKAPDGFLVNPQEYTVTIANGNVTWSPGIPPIGDSKWISDTPTQVEWDKVDAGYVGSEFDTKNPIAGSIWELEKFTPNGDNGTYTSVSGYDNITDCIPTSDSSCSQTVDKDNAAGKFKLLGLNSGLYRLHEKDAPEGYTSSDAYFYFEMKTSNPSKFVKGTATSFDKTTGLTSNGEGSANVVDKVVPNYRNLGTVDWTKVSSEEANGEPLSGAEWTIKFKAEGTGKYGAEYKIVDCMSGDCAVPSGAKQPDWTYDRDPAVGKFKLENLQWGDYEFYETKAPDGYNLSTEPYTFTVSKSNVNTTIAITGSGVSDNKIPNEPGFELPATGGEGNTLIPLLGVALTAISMLGCAIAMRKRI